MNERTNERSREERHQWISNFSVNQWSNDPTNQWNDSVNQWLSVSVIQWINDPTHEWTCESMNQRMSESMNQWTSESLNQWITDSVNQWISEPDRSKSYIRISKCWKIEVFRALLEDEVGKMCTRLWRGLGLTKNGKKNHVRNGAESSPLSALCEHWSIPCDAPAMRLCNRFWQSARQSVSDLVTLLASGIAAGGC